jgi:hypothetical protein
MVCVYKKYGFEAHPLLAPKNVGLVHCEEQKVGMVT